VPKSPTNPPPEAQPHTTAPEHAVDVDVDVDVDWDKAASDVNLLDLSDRLRDSICVYVSTSIWTEPHDEATRKHVHDTST
jgi:hypothetical protein